MAKHTFLLFDLDGVLIKPGGYRAASQDTMAWFFEQAGIEANLPGEDGLARFEAIMITNEWDMVPIALAMVLDELGRREDPFPVECGLEALLAWVKGKRLGHVFVDYFARIEQLPRVLKPKTIPSEAILHACEAKSAGDLFDHVPAGVLRELLADTRNVRYSLTTRIFQQFILGSEIFSQVYGLDANLVVESYLLKMDKPLLSSVAAQKLVNGMAEGRFSCAGLTLRPSLPPIERHTGNAIYSPETDLAKSFIGLKQLPIVGYGEMTWLADKMGIPAENLVKPMPYQAITAMTVAHGFQLGEAFDWVGQLYLDGESDGKCVLPEDIELHVFEDSVVGILSCQRAAHALMNKHNITVIAHGIAVHPVKVEALKAVGAAVFPDINQALASIGI